MSRSQQLSSTVQLLHKMQQLNCKQCGKKY
jgi:hypothetical protein